MPPDWLNSPSALPDMFPDDRRADVIIVGYGLAGACLTEMLLRKGLRIAVIDNEKAQTTKVGAGIINPWIFRHLTLSWRVRELLPFARDFYAATELRTSSKFVYPLKIMRIFGQDESERWDRVETNGDVHRSKMIDAQKNFPYIKAVFGCGVIEQSFRVDTASLLNSLYGLHLGQVHFIREVFQADKLLIKESEVVYDHIYADSIVFCEGHRAIDNPYFNFIPFRPVKGELMTILMSGMQEEYIVNRDVFLLPLGNGLFRLGSTYLWDDLTEEPTEAAARQLIAGLEKITDLPYSVLSQEAGIRPAVTDRRPVAGCHPEFNRLWILNGLGARGALIAPWLSHYLANQMRNNNDPDPEVDPLRFYRNIS